MPSSLPTYVIICTPLFVILVAKSVKKTIGLHACERSSEDVLYEDLLRAYESNPISHANSADP